MSFKSSQSLQGKRIIITRSQHQQAEARRIFEKIGANVLDLPALIIGPPDDWTALDNALKRLDDFDWLIFSSSNGVVAIQERLHLMGKDLASGSGQFKIAAVGKKTAKTLETIGVKTDFIPPDFVAESLLENFPESKLGLRILLPRVQSGGRNILANVFEELGMVVEEVPAYESRCPEVIPAITLQSIQSSKVDAIVFTSGKTVRHSSHLLEKYFGNEWLSKLEDIKLISIGPQTSLSCKKYFSRVDKEAHPHDLEGLALACIEAFKA